MKDVLSKPFSAVYRRSRRIVVQGTADLIAVAGFILVATLVLSAVETPLLRAVVGLPLLLFVPGYVTVSVLFPRAKPVSAAEEATLNIAQSRALSDTERLALAFGVSVVLLPLFGLAIAAMGVAYTSATVVGTIGGLSLMGGLVAIARRLSLPAADRYDIAFGRRVDAALSGIFDTRSTAQTLLNVALIASMVLALSTVGYALVAPQDGETHTGLQLLSEEDDELVAADYPESIEPGESIPLVIAVENHEQERQEYTVVVQEQRLEDGEVVERTEIDEIEYDLADGETGYADRELTPTPEEGPVRLSVQVYLDDDVPETPTHDDAYREAYIWTDVEA